MFTIGKRRIIYVFQDALLFPNYRVRGNLQYGMAAGMLTPVE
jgi:molybdate transport system ATP-binding protein